MKSVGDIIYARTINYCFICCLFCICLSSAAQNLDRLQTIQQFEKMAYELDYLHLETVLYDRDKLSGYYGQGSEEVTEYFRILKKVTCLSYSKEELIELLEHDSAKVRTLATVALFDRSDPSVLPNLFELRYDSAKTFDGYPKQLSSFYALSGSGPPKKVQDVGYVVRNMITFYTRESGLHSLFHDKAELKFYKYWRARKHRSHAAGWFAVQLKRARRGSSYTNEDVIRRIKSIRKSIDKLPFEESAWTLLWLHQKDGGKILVSESEVVSLCKKLGTDKLALMLQCKIPIGDPDLQSQKSNNWPYYMMVKFVLKYAEQLFKSSDSDLLLSCEKEYYAFNQNNFSADWSIAAAKLNPQRAAQILHDSYDNCSSHSHRAEICAALWKFVGEAESKFILKWFYNEAPKHDCFYLERRRKFIELVGENVEGQGIIRQIIQNDNFNSIDWISLEALIEVINRWVEKPLFNRDDILRIKHPDCNKWTYNKNREKLVKEYPEETLQLEQQLERWRRKISKSVDSWTQGVKKKPAVRGKLILFDLWK